MAAIPRTVPRKGCVSRGALCKCHSSRPLHVRTGARPEIRYREWMHRPGRAALGVALTFTLAHSPPAVADLNEYEAAAGGEFNIGSARQYGEADIKGQSFAGQDLRRSNFTSADCRDCNFKDTKLQGAYFIKAVLARANFENADISDNLMDRAVLNEANLRNANLQRTVLTRSDLTGAKVEGADFSNALVDKTQQMALCKYASGRNSSTGADTRKSLGCGSRRAFRASQPSSSEGPQVEESSKEAFKKTMPIYRQ